MAAAWPGASLRPHVKAFKSTALARRLADGRPPRRSAAPRSARWRAWPRPGWATTCCWPTRCSTRADSGALVEAGARVTVAVDSRRDHRAAASAAACREVLIDVNVGLPRCGCVPADAGRLADQARAAGLDVRGVMGYEGHLVGLEDRAAREAGVEPRRMALLVAAHEAVGGDVVSGGGTGTWDLNHAGHRAPGRLLPADGHRLRQARPALPPGAVGARHGHLGRTATAVGRWPTSGSRPSAWTTASPRWSTPTAPESGSAPTSTLPSVRRGRAGSPAGRRPGAGASRPTSTRPSPTTSACTSPRATRSSTCWPVDLRNW